MIKNIVFDFGGVLTTIDTGRALSRFKALGLDNPQDYINSYCQKGPFFALENGDITADEFCLELGALCKRSLGYDDAIVHIFQSDTRDFYDLERIWKDATPIDMSDIQIED